MSEKESARRYDAQRRGHGRVELRDTRDHSREYVTRCTRSSQTPTPTPSFVRFKAPFIVFPPLFSVILALASNLSNNNMLPSTSRITTTPSIAFFA